MAIKDYPPEVLAYFAKGERHVASVSAPRPYIIQAWFDDGVCKQYDMSGELYGALECLRDFALFRAVTVDSLGCIAWDTPAGHIDTSKDTVYIYGTEVNP